MNIARINPKVKDIFSGMTAVALVKLLSQLREHLNDEFCEFLEGSSDDIDDDERTEYWVDALKDVRGALWVTARMYGINVPAYDDFVVGVFCRSCQKARELTRQGYDWRNCQCITANDNPLRIAFAFICANRGDRAYTNIHACGNETHPFLGMQQSL